MLVSYEEQVLEYKVCSEFLTINNVLKYEALLARLHLAGPLNAYPFKVHSDSQLVVSQCQEVYKAKEPIMQQYLQKVRSYLKAGDKSILITYILREDNHQTDLMSKLASLNLIDLFVDVQVEAVEKLSVGKKIFVVIPINNKKDWRTLIMHYLLVGELPSTEISKIYLNSTTKIFISKRKHLCFKKDI